MKLSANTILITGGASGIGLAFAERFLAAGSEVIICGRREDKLREVQEKHPAFHTRVCDVADENERIELFKWATGEFPNLNVLVNNAGVQRRVNLLETEDWQETQQEIRINFDAPVHLSRLFIRHLLKQNHPAILNVTSGLSFVPLANVPVYCATKAALHSFTLSLRYQLKDTPIKVVEIIPPAVDTDLGGVGLHTFGVPLDEFADFVFEHLKTEQNEIAFGTAQKSSQASREELNGIFEFMNKQFG
jgi:uncharacterized oxidoreductase